MRRGAGTRLSPSQTGKSPALRYQYSPEKLRRSEGNVGGLLSLAGFPDTDKISHRFIGRANVKNDGFHVISITTA